MKHTIIYILGIFILQGIVVAQNQNKVNGDDCCCEEKTPPSGSQACGFSGQSEDVTITAKSTDISAPGANDGTFTILGSGIYDIDFSTGTMADGVSSAIAIGLSPGLYTATITDEEGCIALKEVEINGDVLLAIELLSFRGVNTSSGNRIYWQTASELESAYFILEKSLDGAYFESIAEVPAAGKSSKSLDYEFLDKAVAPLNYYRLLEKNLQGEVVIVSEVILVKGNQSYHSFTLQPNPAGDLLHLNFYTNTITNLEVFIYNAPGKKTAYYQLMASIGLNNKALDVSTLPAGNYFMICSGQGYSENLNFLKK